MRTAAGIILFVIASCSQSEELDRTEAFRALKIYFGSHFAEKADFQYTPQACWRDGKLGIICSVCTVEKIQRKEETCQAFEETPEQKELTELKTIDELFLTLEGCELKTFENEHYIVSQVDLLRLVSNEIDSDQWIVVERILERDSPNVFQHSYVRIPHGDGFLSNEEVRVEFDKANSKCEAGL